MIKILAINAGLADIDSNGDDLADDAPTLAALGITTAERQQLAALYTPDQSLWRMPIPHFTDWDANWGWGPPLGATFWTGTVAAAAPCPPCRRLTEGSNIGTQEAWYALRSGKSCDVVSPAR